MRRGWHLRLIPEVQVIARACISGTHAWRAECVLPAVALLSEITRERTLGNKGELNLERIADCFLAQS